MLKSSVDSNRDGTMERTESWLAPVFEYIGIRTVNVPFVALTALGAGVDGAEPTGSIIITVPLRVASTYTLAVLDQSHHLSESMS